MAEAEPGGPDRNDLGTRPTPWLKPLTDGHGEATLFVLPAAGAWPGSYRTWQALAPPGLDVTVVHIPGREDRIGEEPYTDVAPLAAQIAKHVDDHADRPFGIFGHSAGALIGREVAKRITSLALRLFVVAASPSPDLLHTAAPDISDAELFDALDTWRGTPRGLLADPEIAAVFLRPLRADLLVAATCKKPLTEEEVLDLPIIGFGGTADRTTPIATVAAWENWTSAAFRFHVIDGDHFFPVTAGSVVLDTIAQSLLPGSTSPVPRSCPPSGETGCTT